MFKKFMKYIVYEVLLGRECWKISIVWNDFCNYVKYFMKENIFELIFIEVSFIGYVLVIW